MESLSGNNLIHVSSIVEGKTAIIMNYMLKTTAKEETSIGL